jgi:cytochrome c peroxidase
MNILHRTAVTGRLLIALHLIPLVGGLIFLTAPIRAATASGSAKILNFSGRAAVGAGSNVLITGFVVSEGATKTVLLRAVGPGLAAFGVTGALAEPTISLFSGTRLVQNNTRWNTAANAAEIRAGAMRVGAFPLAENSRDSAIVATVSTGSYNVMLSGANNAAGIALVEVYDLDAPPAHDEIKEHADALFSEGKKIFRDDTFGSETFWGDKLRLHTSIAGEKLGGVGAGLSARQALSLGLKVDVERLPQSVIEALLAGQVDLDKPDTTVALLKADAVVGVKVFLEGARVRSMGITCALCHSTVDNSLTAGIGRRLDGWPNRDLNVGEIVAFSPSVKPIADALGLSEETVRTVLRSWGPGKYDAELDKDGKAFQPDGRSAATVLPAAFGLAGQNLHTYTGWGSVPYWNAYVAVTQMHGQGTFIDSRLDDAARFPLAAKAGIGNLRPPEDLVSAKLPALHYYQISIPAPKPPAGSFDVAAATRGQTIFNGKAMCATCHVPPLYSEPGHKLHRGAAIGIDDFHANRSPTGAYRTTPLKGLFAREKGGFYHDGRFNGYDAVINHYKPVLKFELTSSEQSDLVQFLRSL